MSALPTVRWTFTDMDTGESYTVPINPNNSSDPEGPARNLTYAYGVAAGQERVRTIERPPDINTWQFGGVIYTKEHYDALASWARKTGLVHISDHLGRTFEVIMQTFEPTDRRPRPNRMWNLTYTMRAMVLRRVS